jgi:hypothetical protein
MHLLMANMECFGWGRFLDLDIQICYLVWHWIYDFGLEYSDLLPCVV